MSAKIDGFGIHVIHECIKLIIQTGKDIDFDAAFFWHICSLFTAFRFSPTTDIRKDAVARA